MQSRRSTPSSAPASQINPFAPIEVSRAGRRLDAYPVAKCLERSISASMEGQSGSSRRRERVIFETDRHLVVGQMTLPTEGYQSRFSDAINRADVAFVPLLDVEITPLGGGETVRRDFIVLAKEHIRLAFPAGGDSR
jgi:hypothetical protein